MVVKVWKYNVTSAKKAHHLHLAHALYVPSMPVTLISTKALFKNEGIRTYFNDELWLALPDGDYVRFIETRTNYTLQFIDDAEPTPGSVHDTPKDFPAAHAITLREPLSSVKESIENMILKSSATDGERARNSKGAPSAEL